MDSNSIRERREARVATADNRAVLGIVKAYKVARHRLVNAVLLGKITIEEYKEITGLPMEELEVATVNSVKEEVHNIYEDFNNSKNTALASVVSRFKKANYSDQDIIDLLTNAVKDIKNIDPSIDIRDAVKRYNDKKETKSV